VCVLLLPISHALLLAVARARVAGFEGVRSAVSIGVMALSVWVAAGKCRGGVKGAERDVPAPARVRAPRVHARRVWRASRPTDVLPRSLALQLLAAVHFVSRCKQLARTEERQ